MHAPGKAPALQSLAHAGRAAEAPEMRIRKDDVAGVQDDRVMFLGNQDFSQKIGRKVRILAGPFEGVVGTIYRVKKDRRVVVTLDNVASVAISYIDPSLLQEL